jgi:hypothetical protein
MDTSAMTPSAPLTVSQPVLRLQMPPGAPDPVARLLEPDQFIVGPAALETIRLRATTGVLAPEQTDAIAGMLTQSDPRVMFAHLAAMAAASAPAGAAVAQFVGEQMASYELSEGMHMEMQPLLLTEDLVARDSQGGAFLSPDKRLALMQPDEYVMNPQQLQDFVSGYRAQAGFELLPHEQLQQAENEWQNAISALRPDQLGELQKIEDEVQAQVASGHIPKSEADVVSASRQATWCQQAYHSALSSGQAQEANAFLPIFGAMDKYLFAQQRMAVAAAAQKQVREEDLPPAMRERIDGARQLLASLPGEYQPLVSTFAGAIENHTPGVPVDDSQLAAVPAEQREVAKEVVDGGLATMGADALHAAVRPFTTASLLAGFLAETRPDDAAATKFVEDVQNLSLSLVSSINEQPADGKSPEQTAQDIVTRLPAAQQQTFNVLDQAATEITEHGTVSSPSSLLANVPDEDKSAVLGAVYATAANLQASPAIGSADVVGLVMQASYAELKADQLEAAGDHGPLQQDMTNFKAALGQLFMQASFAGAAQLQEALNAAEQPAAAVAPADAPQAPVPQA